MDLNLINLIILNHHFIPLIILIIFNFIVFQAFLNQFFFSFLQIL
jgi:hypothetical protein